LKSKTSKSLKQPQKPKFTRYEKLTTVPLPLRESVVRKPNKKGSDSSGTFPKELLKHPAANLIGGGKRERRTKEEMLSTLPKEPQQEKFISITVPEGTEIIKDPNIYASSDPLNVIYLFGGTLLFIAITIFAMLLVTGCTYNVSMAHTSGIASHVIEESETDTVDPSLSVPTI
jgi:hypothetical protein